MTLEDELNAFTGTTAYHRHPLGVLYTDGVHHLAEKARAYWLLDIVASYQPKLKAVHFQLWELERNPDRTAVITAREDDGHPDLVRQEIESTDFPMPFFSFYVIDGVMLLKSEY